MSDEELAESLAQGVDKAVFGLCEVLALLFMLPFGDAMYDQRPLTLRMWVFLVIGAVFAVIGPLWTPARKKFPHQAVLKSFGTVAGNAGAWILILLVAFIYLLPPGIFQRQPPVFEAQVENTKQSAPTAAKLVPQPSLTISRPDAQPLAISLSASSLKPTNIPTSLEVQVNTTDQPPEYVTDKNIYAWTFLPVQIYKETTCPPPLSIGIDFSNPTAFPSTNLFSPNASSPSTSLLSGLPFSKQNGELSKQPSFPLNFSTSSASSPLNSQECDTAVKQWIFFLMFQRPVLYKNLTFDAHGAALPNIAIQETDPYYAEFLVQGSLPTMVLDIGTTN